MTTIYFNTNTFDRYVAGAGLDITTDPERAELLVLGAKRVSYAAFPQLQAVYRFGVGDENIEYATLQARGIDIHFPSPQAQAILFDATANFTVFGILSMLLAQAFGEVDQWQKQERAYLGTQSALVIGVGNIGRRVAEKLRVFMPVQTYDTLQDNTDGVLDRLLAAADVITVHIPLTPQTEHLFDRRRLGLVKDQALLVNTARGAIFDEAALYDKLSNSQCRAFFDVFWQEPYEGPLKALGPRKFFMTPHSASNTREFVQAGFQDILTIVQGLDAHA